MAEEIHKNLSKIIGMSLKDPRVRMLTITSVEVSSDFRVAVVYFSVLGGREESQRTEQGLSSSRSFLRKKLGSLSRLRRIPELQFRYDESLDKSDRLTELIENAGGKLDGG